MRTRKKYIIAVAVLVLFSSSMLTWLLLDRGGPPKVPARAMRVCAELIHFV
jgi:hypothetical protein